MADRNALPPAVLEALRRGDKIAAIKVLREMTKIGLADAKGAIDALEAAQSRKPAAAAKPGVSAKPGMHAPAHHPQRRPREDDLGPGEVPRNSTSAAAIAVMLAAAALGAWYYLR